MTITSERLQQFLEYHAYASTTTSNSAVDIVNNKDKGVNLLATSSQLITMKDITDLSIFFENHTITTETLFKEYIIEITKFSSLQFINLIDFQIFNKFFSILLEFARYDISSLRKLYALSHIFSLKLTDSVNKDGNAGNATKYQPSTMITTKYSVRNHPVWNNLPFWIDVTKATISEDLDRYDFITSTLVRLSYLQHHAHPTTTSTTDSPTSASLDDEYHEMTFFRSHFCHLTSEQVLFFVIMTRIDSITSSMRSLLLSKDLIDSYQQTILQKLHIKDFFPNVEITESSINYWYSLKAMVLLTIIKRLQLPPKHSNSTSSMCIKTDDYANAKHPHYLQTPFYFHMTVWNDFCDKYTKYGFQTWKLTENYQYYEIGYTSILQLLYLPSLFTILYKDDIYQNKFPYLRKNPQNLWKHLGICYCGHQQYYSAWKLIGKINPSLYHQSNKSSKVSAASSYDDHEDNHDNNLLEEEDDDCARQGIINENIQSIVNKMKLLTRNYEDDAIIEEKHIQILEEDDAFTNHLPSVVCEYCYRQLFFQYPNTTSSSQNPLNLTMKTPANMESNSQVYDIVTIGSASIAYPLNNLPLKKMLPLPEHLRSILVKPKLEEFVQFIYGFYAKTPAKRILPLQSLHDIVELPYDGADSKIDRAEDRKKRSGEKEVDERIARNMLHLNKSKSDENEGSGIHMTLTSGPTSPLMYATRRLPAIPIKVKSASSDTYDASKKPSTDSLGSENTAKTGETVGKERRQKLLTVSTTSAASTATATDLAPSPSSLSFRGNEFQNFLIQLWNGITVTLIYSNHPLVAKTRVIFMRSNSALNDEIFRKKITILPTSKNITHLQLVEWLRSRSIPLYIGWAHLRDRDNLTYDIKKSISLYDVKGMKVGAKQYKNCMKIITDLQIIMMKIDNDTYFEFVHKGLIELFSNVSSSFSK